VTGRPLLVLSLALGLNACSGGGGGDDVPPLPEQNAETANQLMSEAERAAANAASQMETVPRAARSGSATVNEVTNR
jgi:hypothetical protein